jgi:hypothetical protein
MISIRPSARRFMFDLAKLIHEAIGIESPKAFIALFALVGLVMFGSLGWLIERGYRAKLKEQDRTQALVSTGDSRRPTLSSPEKLRVFVPSDASPVN